MMRCRITRVGATALAFAALVCAGEVTLADSLSDLGPVAHWRFDEGEGMVALDSAGESHGLVRGATWAEGVSGGALVFDGVDDYVEVPRTPALEPPEAITVAMWAFMDVEQTSDTRLLRKSGHIGDGYILAADAFGDGVMQLRLDRFHTGPRHTRVADPRPDTTYLGSWHHLAGVYGGTFAAFYVDGFEVRRISHQDGPLSHVPPSNLWIAHGGSAPDGHEHFEGRLDEVMLFELALGADEVLRVYTAQSP